MAPNTSATGSHFGPMEATSFLRGASSGTFLRTSAKLAGINSRIGRSIRSLFKENFRHHPLVFVIKEMAVKDGHSSDYRVGEVHNDVDGGTVWNVHGVQPQRVGNWLIVFGVRQEMDLMDVHGMQFPTSIDDPPVLISPHLCSHHRIRVRREFLSVDVKTLLVFREYHDESRWCLLFRRQVQGLEISFARTLQYSWR